MIKSLDQKWNEQAKTARAKAETLPAGAERNELMRMARNIEIATHMNEWLSSPGLQPPKEN